MRTVFATAALLIFSNLPAAAAGGSESAHDRLAAARAWAVESAAATVPASDASTCVFQSIACGQTINGSLDPGDCQLSDGSVVDFFQFNGTAGESITATLTSNAFPPFLDLLDAVPNSRAYDGEPVTAQVHFTLDSTGVWTLGATNNHTFYQAGAYTLSLTCGSVNANCTADDNTLCLNNGRFKVKATFDTGTGNSGNAHAVAFTGDTGYLWFFSSSNVEAVIKILNGCGLGGHYWFFAGGLTDVNVVITVTDTQTQTVKTYTNPPHTRFQPIQDTSAFATCP
jgi:hypothetical protein